MYLPTEACLMEEDGVEYIVECSEPLPFVESPDPAAEIIELELCFLSICGDGAAM